MTIDKALIQTLFFPRNDGRYFTSAILTGITLLMLSGCVATAPAVKTPPPQTTEVVSPQQPASPPQELDAEFIYEYLLADIAIRRGFTDEAMDALVRLARSSRNQEMASRAFRSAMHAGRGEVALEMADLIEELDPSTLRSAFAKIQALLLVGQRTPAIDAISNLLDQPGTDVARVFNNASEVFARQENPGQFVEAFRDLVDRFPEIAEGYYALAYLANRARRMPELKQAVNRALELRPFWEDAAVVNFTYLVGQSTPDEVIEFSKAFLDSNPAARELRDRLARFLVRERKMPEALEQFEILVRQDRDNSEALLAVGIVRLQLEKLPAARRSLRRYLDLKPDDDQARIYLGEVEHESGNHAMAIDWYSAVDDERYYIEAQLRIADALVDLEGFDLALEHLYEQIPSNQEDEVRIYLAQERILRRAERIDDALLLMHAAIQEIPDNTELLYTRALLAAELDLLDQHETDIRRVIELDPKNAHAYNALGYTLADQETRLDEAFSLITQALSLAPNDPFILDSMGWVSFRLGRIKEAINYLKRAISIRPDAEIAAHLGEVLWLDGQKEAAEQVWRDGIRQDPDNETLKNTLKRLKQE